MSGRILVMRGGALGDFVLGLPALTAIRQAFPDACLKLLAPRAVLPLAANVADSAASIDLAENAPLFDEVAPSRDLPERYRGLDLAVIWLADPEGAVRRNFERLGARRVLHAPALPPRDGGVHATDHLLATLGPLGVGGGGAPPIVPPVGRAGGPSPAAGDALTPTAQGPWRCARYRQVSQREREIGGLSQGEREESPGARASRSCPVVVPAKDAVERATALLRGLGLSPMDPVLAVHPGSGGRWKCWPPDRFARVIEKAGASGFTPVLIQGPADEETAAAVLGAIEGGRPPVIRDLPVEDLAALLSLSAAYLGNDSGVTHLAAAAGAPTVALFGPTDPAVWGPRGRNVTIVRGDGGRLEAIDVEQMMRVLAVRRGV